MVNDRAKYRAFDIVTYPRKHQVNSWQTVALSSQELSYRVGMGDIQILVWRLLRQIILRYLRLSLYF